MIKSEVDVDDVNSDNEHNYEYITPDIADVAAEAKSKILPQKSRDKYESAYKSFMDWRAKKKLENFSEPVFLAYMKHLSDNKKPSTLWSVYSMLRSTLSVKHNVKINEYINLIAFLKRNSKGFKPTKSSVLTSEQVKKFLLEAPDKKFLVTKVAMIFGVYGACRLEELTNLTLGDLEKQGELILVKIPKTETDVSRSFVIDKEHSKLIEKYQNLRSLKAKTDRFFLAYRNEKCTAQPIGRNSFAKMPQQIAKFLNLPHSELYTGHCFRRTSVTLLANAGASLSDLKRHGAWRSPTIVEGYIAHSVGQRKKTMNKISAEIDLPCSSVEEYRPQEVNKPQPVEFISVEEDFNAQDDKTEGVHDKSVLQSQQREKSSFSSKSIRVPTQNYVKQMRNIAPANLTAGSANQQGQQPKTLVLKTIPLKVKQVAPTTIKMPPRQSSQGAPQNTAPQQAAEVCLRWNSYHSNMQNSFPSLLDSEQFVDVTLACEGRSLKCHKMILSSCSDYLAELLRENPCQHPIILMKDLKFWEVEALVKFMYRGEVNVAHEKLPQLLNAAEALQIKGLAGPSSQNSKPPLLIPQAKSQTQSAYMRLPETKENKPSTSSGSATTPSSPKRGQKRQASELMESFTKIRLQRPNPSASPNTTVKLEPLDIPLSPTEIFTDNNLMGLHEEEDPGGSVQDCEDRDMNFDSMDGPTDLTDGEDQMEFVPTDFLDQEQDIVEDIEPDSCLSDREESRKSENSEDCDSYQVDEIQEFDKRDKFEEIDKPPTEKSIITRKDKV